MSHVLASTLGTVPLVRLMTYLQAVEVELAEAGVAASPVCATLDELPEP